MIRSALRYIAAPLLGSLGAAVVRAARDESDRADNSERDLHHEQGRSSELRSLLAASNQALESLRDDHGYTLDRMSELQRERDGMRSELDSAAADDEVHTLTAQALQERTADLAVMTIRAESAETLYRDLIRVHGAHVAALDNVEAAECAWCLGESDPTYKTQWPLCEYHVLGVIPSADEIRARVALRARCCPTRRTSPDPLAVVCALGCGAAVGEECHPGREPVAD